MFRPIPLPDGNYADSARSFVHQDVVNLIRVNAEAPGTRNSFQLKTVPGLLSFVDVSGISRQRGGYVAEGRFYVVMDQTLYQIVSDESVMQLGTIPGNGRVSFSHNQITNGNEVLITNGTQGFIWNTATEELTQITDEGFLGGLLADFIGSRFITLDPARRLFQNSELADGLAWNSTEYYAAEISPDRIRAIKALNNEVVALGDSSMDHFAYTGTTNALFENKGIALSWGCASSYAVAVMDNALWFLDNKGSFCEKRGYEIRRVSSHAIEQTWAGNDWSKAFCMVWEDRGHKVVYITFPVGANKGTWGFDVATRTWHRRESYGMGRWRANWCVQWNGDWYAGEYNGGRIFKLDWDYPLEGSDCLSREGSLGVLHNNGNRMQLHAVRMNVEVGPSIDAQSVTPTIPEIPGDAYLYVASTTGVTCPSYYQISALSAEVVDSGPDTDAFLNGWTKADRTGMWGVSTPALAFGFYDFATDTFTVLNSEHTYGLFVVDSTETYAYVQADFPNSILYKIRLSDGTIVDSEAYTGAGIGLVIDAEDAYVYTHGYTGTKLGVYNIAAGTMASNEIGINQCRDSCLSIDGDSFFSVCANDLTPYLAKYNTSDLTGASIASADAVELPAAGAAVRCNPDGLTIAVSSYGGSSVWIYDVATLTGPPATITVEGSPSFLVYRADGKRLFVINQTGDSCSVIDSEAGSATVNTVLSTIPLPVAPGRPSLVAA